MQLQTSEPLYQIMLARYYGNGLPRFLSPDPIGGSANRPQSWNRYSYVLGNPMKLVDPSGMYGINPNPYNPGGSNPCDGRGPMCHDFSGGTKEERDKAYGAQEELRKSLTPETKAYFRENFGRDIDEELQKPAGGANGVEGVERAASVTRWPAGHATRVAMPYHRRAQDVFGPGRMPRVLLLGVVETHRIVAARAGHRNS